MECEFVAENSSYILMFDFIAGLRVGTENLKTERDFSITRINFDLLEKLLLSGLLIEALKNLRVLESLFHWSIRFLFQIFTTKFIISDNLLIISSHFRCLSTMKRKAMRVLALASRNSPSRTLATKRRRTFGCIEPTVALFITLVPNPPLKCLNASAKGTMSRAFWI